MGAALTAAGATLMARRTDGSAPEKPHEGEEEGEQNGLPAAPDWNGQGLCTLVVYACIKVGAESEAADYAG